jgi:hypothetical protein
MRRSILSLLSLLIYAATAQGQVVNIESLRTQTDTTGWLGSAGMGFSLNKNIREVLGLNMEAHLQYKSKDTKNLWLIIGDYGFLQGGDEKYVSNSFAHTRYNRKLNRWLRWEVFAQAQNNLITRIDWRLLLGTGPRLKVIDKPMFRLYAATLLMYEREKEGVKPTIYHRDLRSSSYISFTFLPSENIELVSTTFYQPLLKYVKDHRLLNQISLKVKASKKFSMNMRWNYLYDRFPAGDTPHTTYNLTSGLEYCF